MEIDITGENVLMTIQNSKKPDQVIHLVKDEPNGVFQTHGLKRLFGVEEIRVKASELAFAVPEYAQVLSFLIETMSAAQDLGLPYVYQDIFEFADSKYSLYGEGGYRLLSKVPE